MTPDPFVFALALAGAIVAAIALIFRHPTAVIDHPRSVLLVWTAVGAGALAALIRLDPFGFTIDVDPASEPLLLRSDPGRAVYAQAIADFGSDDVYVVAMETDDVFRRESLQTLQRVTNEIRRLPGISSVESLTYVSELRYDRERDMVRSRRLIERIPEDDAELEALRERVLGEALYRKTLVSADGRSAAINLRFQPMTDGDFIELGLDGRIAAILAGERADGIDFYVAGRPHVRARAYHTIVGDMARLVPIAVVIAAIVLFAMSGSTRGVLIPLAACVSATLWVFGAKAFLGIDINLITLVLPSMMICLGSVYGVHVYARYEVIAREAADRRDAALRTLEYARIPVVMAGLTTCIGFGALLLADIPATNALGAFSILGIAAIAAISLSALPAALVLLPFRRQDAAGWEGTRLSRWFEGRMARALAAISKLVIGRPGLVLAGWGAATLAAIAVVPNITIDTDVITFFAEESPVRTDFAEVNRLLTGTVPIYVALRAPEGRNFREPEMLEAAAALQRRLESTLGVSEVLSLVDFVRIATRALRDGDPEQAVIPDSRGALAESIFLLPKPTLHPFSTANHTRVNLIVRSGEAGSASIRALERRIRDAVAAEALPSGTQVAVTGNAILLNRSADAIAGNQLMQVGFAALAIFVLLRAVFRSLRIALVSMLPNISPVLIFFGLLGAGVAPLSLPTGLIGCIALGIAIDDTMHFLVAYQNRRARGLTPEMAASECISQVGRPIVMTSIMLVAGFLVVLASGFATLQEFGYLTAMTMAICLCGDLLLLPALLVRVRA